MYIAIKWLLIMAMAMWITLCCIDVFLSRNKEIDNTGPRDDPTVGFYKNETVIKEKQEVLKEHSYFHHVGRGVNLFNYFTFFAGACFVSIYNRKKEIISFAKSSMKKIKICATLTNLRTQLHSNETVIVFRVAILKCFLLIWRIFQKVSRNIFNRIQKIPCILRFRQAQNRKNLNILLLRKMREIGEQRDNLGQLLVAAIKENKNIRMQHQLEAMAKNRLLRHIDVTQKQMKENRSRYVSFQQLYLVAHQENNFLKARVTKLTRDKEEAERNLMRLVNEVYHSKNTELKAYCSRFIVKTKDNLLQSDVKAEIQKFLQKSHRPTATTSNWKMTDPSDIDVNVTRSWPSTRVIDNSTKESLVPVGTDAPKLRGLPGEYVWTVKDKDGIIEKLYEYDLGYNFDNGDTIRRIRQYSVYHDRDCLLDFANSRTIIQDTSLSSRSSNQFPSTDIPSNQKFLTGSEAFRRFLLNNNDNIISSPSPSPSLMCR